MIATVIQINSLEAVFGLVSVLVSVGIAWGKLNNSVKNIQKTLDMEIKPELKENRSELFALREQFVGLNGQFTGLEVKFTTLEKQFGEIGGQFGEIKKRQTVTESQMKSVWRDHLARAHSPRQLNENGLEIFRRSGIKEIIDTKKSHLLELIKQTKPATAYDAERAIEEVVMKIPSLFPETEVPLKNGAFEAGAEIIDVLFTGSIYLRDQILPDLGFNHLNTKT